MELQFSAYGDLRNEQIAVDADAHASAVRDWLHYAYEVTPHTATDGQYAAARAVVDDPAHWADVIDIEGSGVRSLASLEAEQKQNEGRA